MNKRIHRYFVAITLLVVCVLFYLGINLLTYTFVEPPTVVSKVSFKFVSKIIKEKKIAKPEVVLVENEEPSVLDSPLLDAETSSLQDQHHSVESRSEILSVNAKNEYLDRVFKKIADKKFYPASSKRFRQQGVVGVKFFINKEGLLSELEIIKKTDFSRLNQAAIKIVELSSPFLPLPKEYLKPKMEVIVDIKFAL